MLSQRLQNTWKGAGSASHMTSIFCAVWLYYASMRMNKCYHQLSCSLYFCCLIFLPSPDHLNFSANGILRLVLLRQLLWTQMVSLEETNQKWAPTGISREHNQRCGDLNDLSIKQCDVKTGVTESCHRILSLSGHIHC